MTTPKQLIRSATLQALRVRARAGYALDRPFDVYEATTALGLELQFVEMPSLEGMYISSRSPQRVLVSALRPAGRQRVTAAHELGHHVFGHGTTVDLVDDKHPTSSRDEELVANHFAYTILMPRRAVTAGFLSCGADAGNPAPVDVYRVASWLGVGYRTLLNQMRHSIGLLSESRFRALERTSAAEARLQLGAPSPSGDLWALDEQWAGTSVHAQLGDYVTGVAEAPHGTLLDRATESVRIAASVGVETIGLHGGSRATLHVSKRAYRGFYDYRYLPEPA